MLDWWQAVVLMVAAALPSLYWLTVRLLELRAHERDPEFVSWEERFPVLRPEPASSQRIAAHVPVPSVIDEQPDDQETLIHPLADVATERYVPDEPRWLLWFTTSATTVMVHRLDCPKVVHARVSMANPRPWKGHPDDSEEAETAAIASGFSICHRCEPFKVRPS